MPKLHELLAVDGNVKAQADKTRLELMGTFKNKTHLFTEKIVSFKPFAEDQITAVESQLDLQTTVPKELKWISEFMIRALDVANQVAEANTVARADVVLEDGTLLLSGVPATSLLELEKRAKELHDFVEAIPTLDPAKGFRPDPDRGADIYQAREAHTTRTKRENRPLVLAPATEKHPAQVQLIEEVVPTGLISTQEWSGLITTAAKGDMLSRVEVLTRAIKKARSRANETEVSAPKLDTPIGAKMVNYVFAL